jgi:hypothetical protein
MYLRHYLARVCRKFFCGQNVQRVDDAWNPTKDSQQDVDEQIAATSALKEDTQWWQKDGEDDLANVAAKHAVSKGLLGSQPPRNTDRLLCRSTASQRSEIAKSEEDMLKSRLTRR